MKRWYVHSASPFTLLLQIKSVKVQIEHLLEGENPYLERDEDNPGMLKYLA